MSFQNISSDCMALELNPLRARWDCKCTNLHFAPEICLTSKQNFLLKPFPTHSYETTKNKLFCINNDRCHRNDGQN